MPEHPLIFVVKHRFSNAVKFYDKEVFKSFITAPDTTLGDYVMGYIDPEWSSLEIRELDCTTLRVVMRD